MTLNRQILLDNRPAGEASVSNFRLVSSAIPPLREGQVLVRNHYLSLDPYMRGRMNDAKSYADPQPLRQVMQGGNAHGRIARCGMIAGNDGQRLAPPNPAMILGGRLRLQGFIISEHMDIWPQALTELAGLVAAGKLRPRESVAQGLASAPEAFLGMLKGRNFGKQLVRLI